MYISSGEVHRLLAGKHTKEHKKLIERFFSDEIPVRNAKNSPIDQFRTGAILEERFYMNLDNRYIPQCEVWSEEMNVCKSTLDFSDKQNNKVVDFIETKSCFFTDFLNLQPIKNSRYNVYVDFIKRYYKQNYNQIQFQLFCSGLTEASLTYIEVKSYNDEENLNRIIQPEETIEFRIKRDEEIISLIKKRASIFQQIKDYYELRN